MEKIGENMTEIKEQINQLRNVVGWYEPVDEKFEVVISKDGDVLDCETQVAAELISQLVQIKEILGKMGHKSTLDELNEKFDKEDELCQKLKDAK